MRVLFITRSFAPDSVIAAKRTTLLAKYFCKLGHEITVIRSGLIIGKAENDNMNGLESVKIYSYEREVVSAECVDKSSEIRNIVEGSGNIIKNNKPYYRKLGHLILDPIIYSRNEGKIIKEKIIKLYKTSKDMRGFDVVISSFSPLGCIQAAEYIREKEHAVWIIDFRDLMDNQNYTVINRFFNSLRQKRFVKNADICLCVSEGNANRLIAENRKNSEKIHTVFNGYEKNGQIIEQPADKGKRQLHICYTGTLFGGKRDCSPLFKVIKESNPSLSVVIDYAGREGDIIDIQAKKYGLENIIINHGYLSRTDVSKLQRQSDLFLVLSWNTKNDQGILTGKFYEALQHKKPVIALISGDVPDSELKILINKYNLGVCYEEATREHSEEELREYISKQYNLKKQEKELEYSPKQEVFDKFEYSNIVKELERIIIEYRESEER